MIAAFDMHSGEVFATDIARNDSITFMDFLERLDRRALLRGGSSIGHPGSRAESARQPVATRLGLEELQAATIALIVLLVIVALAVVVALRRRAGV